MNKFWYDKEIEEEAVGSGLDPKLVKAVVLTESDGRTNAYRFEPAFWMRYCANNKQYEGANPYRVAASYGLMQVMYPTAQQHGFDADHDEPEALFIPEVGLCYGCQHLKSLLDRCQGDVEMALAQYNGGTFGNKTRPFRNQLYVHKVMKLYAGLKGER